MAKLSFEPNNYRRMIKAIEGAQHPESVVSQGERVAAMVLSRTQEQLTKTVSTGDPDVINEMADVLGEAEEILRARHQLVERALARLIVVGPA